MTRSLPLVGPSLPAQSQPGDPVIDDTPTTTTTTTAGGSPRRAAERLAGWLEDHRFTGPDPYSGLTAPRARLLRTRRAVEQAVIQVTKRYPRIAGALLGPSDVTMAKTVALVLSAYALLDQAPTERVNRLHASLLDRQLTAGGFGYEFPVVTRWGRYDQGEPNLVATTFALQGFADAAERCGHDKAATHGLDLARFTLDYFGARTSFLAYHAGSSVLVHNANVLACGQIARAFRVAGLDPPGEVFAAAARTLQAQRPDGAWPYAEHPRCGWVDTFHTLYILDGLHELGQADPDGPWRGSFDRGLAFVRERCLDAHGPVERPDRHDGRLEGHTVGSALAFFARRTTDRDVLVRLLGAADVLARADGSFAAHAANGVGYGPAYPRWVAAHMLAGLAAAVGALEGEAAS